MQLSASLQASQRDACSMPVQIAFEHLLVYQLPVAVVPRFSPQSPCSLWPRVEVSHCYWPAFEWQSVIWYSCPGTFLNTSLKVATPPPRLSSYYSIHLCEGEMFAQVASLSLSLSSHVSLCLNKLPLKQNMLLSHYKQEKWKYLCPCAKITTATTTATTIASRDKSNPEGFYIFLMLLQLEQANGVDRTSDHTTLHTLLPAKCVVFPPLSLPLCI